MSKPIVINKDFYQLMGIVEPTYSVLKTKRRDLEATLREINHYKSIFGTVRRFFGKIQEGRVLNTLTVLLRIAGAIADNLQEKVQQLYELKGEQFDYLGDVNGKIRVILEAMGKQGTGQEGDYTGLVQKIKSKEEHESCDAYSELLERFNNWSESRMNSQLNQEALAEYRIFREEALYNLLGCNYVHKNVKLIAEAVQRSVDHLRYTLNMNKGIIIVGRDLLSARKGLIEVAEKGNKVYDTVKESYSRLEEVMKELRNPRRLLG